MVWAVFMPSTFGKYFLDGDFVGWTEAIEAAWPDDQRGTEDYYRRNYHTSLKFTKDLGPLQDFEKVHELRTEKRVKEIAAMAQTTDQLLIVHEELKTIVETLDPHIHQFWAIKIAMPRGQEFPEQYYGLHIGRFLDSFNPTASDQDAIEHMKTYYRIRHDSKKYTNGLALNETIVDNAHLWRETILSNPNIFISDELHAKATEANLQLPKHFQVRVV